MTWQIHDQMLIDGKRVDFSGYFPSDPAKKGFQGWWLPLPTEFTQRQGTVTKHERIVPLNEDEFRRRYDWSLILNPEEHAAGAQAIYNEPKQTNLGRNITSTACFRGFLSLWEIRGGELFLTDIEGRFELVGGPLEATWFSGTIVVTEGEVLLDLMFSAFHETHRHLDFRNGTLVGEKTIPGAKLLQEYQDEQERRKPAPLPPKKAKERWIERLMESPPAGTRNGSLWAWAVLRRLLLRWGGV
jgi:hypothetical protein